LEICSNCCKARYASIAVPVIEVNQNEDEPTRIILFITPPRSASVYQQIQLTAMQGRWLYQSNRHECDYGGITWKKFIFGDAATMKYVNGASYRTIHNNKCYVIEQIENGSSYKDPTMTGGYTDAQLKSFYNQTTPIVMSFRFTK
jgi:hypothetical protein